MMGSMTEVDACYSVPNISARGYGCKTNLPPSGVMRGAGRPQAAFIAERWIRAVADYLNVPPVKVSDKHNEVMRFHLIGPIPWGHSGPLCHALSLSSSLSLLSLSMSSWTSMRRQRATVPLATSGELA